jgi:pimeloyl-ACP methyl ester carboxylesterase
MANWSEGDLTVNGLNIHYYRTGGEDKPKVVFNHGAMDSGLCWTPVVKALEDAYDCIMVDARGHGKSDIGHGDYASETRAEDLAEAIKALGLDRPVVGGHSMGADGTIFLASAYPELCRAIFLEDPPLAQPSEKVTDPEEIEAQKKMWKQFDQAIQALKSMPEDSAKEMGKEMNPTFPEDEVGPWVTSKRQLSDDFMQGLIHENVLDTSATFDVLQQISLPTLLIIGEKKNGAIISLETAKKLDAEMPNLRYVQLAGASHNIRREKFNDYVAALRGFLAGVYA